MDDLDIIRILSIQHDINRSLINCLKKTLNEKQKEIFNEHIVEEMQEILDRWKKSGTEEEFSLIKRRCKTI